MDGVARDVEGKNIWMKIIDDLHSALIGKNESLVYHINEDLWVKCLRMTLESV